MLAFKRKAFMAPAIHGNNNTQAPTKIYRKPCKVPSLPPMHPLRPIYGVIINQFRRLAPASIPSHE